MRIRKRVPAVLVGFVICLALPSSAWGDGITFMFIGGKVFAQRPIGGANPAYVTNDRASNRAIPASAVTRVHYITRFSGNTPPGVAGPPTLGATTFPNPFNFGTVLFKTGTRLSTTGTTSASFNPGGYIMFKASPGMAAATGGAVPNGDLMFFGTFSSVTTFTQTNFPLTLAAFISQKCGAHPSATCITNNTNNYNNSYLHNFNYFYLLAGNVSGVLSTAVMNYFNLGSSHTGNGFLASINLGFIGPGNNSTTKGSVGNPEGGIVSVVAPEPCAISLFGTGLVAMIGALRRAQRA